MLVIPRRVWNFPSTRDISNFSLAIEKCNFHAMQKKKLDRIFAMNLGTYVRNCSKVLARDKKLKKGQ